MPLELVPFQSGQVTPYQENLRNAITWGNRLYTAYSGAKQLYSHYKTARKALDYVRSNTAVRQASQAIANTMKRSYRSRSRNPPIYKKQIRTDYKSPLARYIRKTACSMTKYYDTSISFTIPPTPNLVNKTIMFSNYMPESGSPVAGATGKDIPILPTIQGAAYGEVSGSKYRVKAVRIQGDVQLTQHGEQNASPSQLDCGAVRIYLIRDTQPNGALPAGNDVMQQWAGTNEQVHGRIALNLAGERFQIIANKLVKCIARNTKVVTRTTTVGAVASADEFWVNTEFDKGFFKMTYKPKNMNVRIRQSSSTPDVVNLVNENMFLIVVPESGLGDREVTVSATARCAYED